MERPAQSAKSVTFSLSSLPHETAPPEDSTLALHDALPIWRRRGRAEPGPDVQGRLVQAERVGPVRHAGQQLAVVRRLVPADRKSTRLNSSHRCSSYAVYCVKKKTRGEAREQADRDGATRPD